MTDLVPIPGCPLCEATDYNRWLSALGFELVRCAACGHRYSTFVHGASVLAHTYYDEPDRDIAARSMAAKAERIEEYFQLLQPSLPEHARVLDVGCNAGELLQLFQARGHQPFGIEVSPGPARHAQERLGVPIWQGFVEDCLPEHERFDLIVLSHVLEHIHRPHVLLRRLCAALGERGRLLIEVPNADDVLLDVWRGIYRPLCPGDHVSFFDAAHLEGVLRQAGFEVLALSSPTHARDVLYPSLLSAVDGMRDVIGRRRAAAPSATGVCAQTRYRGRLRRPLRAGLDAFVAAVDPAVVRATQPWTGKLRGAVLIAVAAASSSATRTHDPTPGFAGATSSPPVTLPQS